MGVASPQCPDAVVVDGGDLDRVVALAAISWLPLFADPSDFQVGES